MRSIISCLAILLIIGGCKENEEASVADDSASEIMMIKLPLKVSAAGNAESKDYESAATADKEIEAKIIKQGNLRFETNDLEKTYNQIRSAVKQHNALVQNDAEGKDFGSLFRNITVRIPSENFDVFIADISKGVGYFDKKEISSQDVTEEYIDLNSRLKTKKVLEIRYLELLKKATKVSEMLEIEKKLSEIREEIDAKEGQLKYMQNRVSMSTVTIEFYKTIAEESGATVTYGTKIWNAIKSGFNGISSFFIGLLQIWPFIIILVGLFLLIRKRLKRRKI
ncbi:DUF4349 domain-containing protein [Flavobacterium sp. GT3R68]|uniref:DUF4349 domain-containing protein n=1 Tax=Flavobacterium sp. GT3R68 TaxID=2594437 RepID=UPI000F8944B5|nr:DUF4349 domain-containing protein [Flavobacterium sp. GT3R68]RTY95861.1 DUF4349 domain-containing protein [Flavobacterium sp. GSN2]TRW93633.1 DUF4349 domain-containing protein [Flavobacterium sp. GT3R68]